MDSLTQASAYVQPAFEYATKLSSIITLWMLLVVMDKRLLGLPLLKGSLWYSPRIPPRFSIKGRSGTQTASSSNLSSCSTGNGSDGPAPKEVALFDSASTERDFAVFTTATHQPAYTPHPQHGSLSVSASGSSALSIYQPLEVHDPFKPSSQRLQPDFIILVVLLVLVLAFLRWFPFGNHEPSQARKTSNDDTPTNDPLDQQAVAMETEIYWGPTLEDLGLSHSEIFAGDYFKHPRAPSPQEFTDLGPQSTATLTSSMTLDPETLSPPQASSPSSDVAVDLASSSPFVHATATVTTPTSSSMTIPLTSTDSAQGTCEEADGATLPPRSLRPSQASSPSSDVAVDVASSPRFVHATSVVTPPTSPITTPHTSTENAQGTGEEAGGATLTPASVSPPQASNSSSEVDPDMASSSPFVHATPAVTPPTSCMTPVLNPTESAQDSRQEARGVGEGMSFVEDIVSEEELSNHGDIPENGGPDEVAAVAEVKPKKKRIRQNAKRRMAKRAAREAEEARQTEEAGPEEKGEAEGEAKEGAGLAEEGEAEEVEPEPNDTPNADLGGAMEAAKKKPRRRQRKHKPKVKDTTQNEIDHEPEKLAEPSEHH